MNDIDIKFLRLEATLQIHKAVLHALVAATSLMPGGELIRQQMQSSLLEAANKMVFPDLSPAMSDLVAAEVQDAAAAFLSPMLKS